MLEFLEQKEFITYVELDNLTVLFYFILFYFILINKKKKGQSGSWNIISKIISGFPGSIKLLILHPTYECTRFSDMEKLSQALGKKENLTSLEISVNALVDTWGPEMQSTGELPILELFLSLPCEIFKVSYVYNCEGLSMYQDLDSMFERLRTNTTVKSLSIRLVYFPSLRLAH